MKNGKLFGKLSWIDLTVILLLIALAVVVAVRFIGFRNSEAAKNSAATTETTARESYDITLRFYYIPVTLSRAPFEKDQGMMVRNKAFGKVLSVESEDVLRETTLADGSVEMLKDSRSKNWVVVTRVPLEEKNGGLYAESGDCVGVGKLLNVCTRYYAGEAAVIRVEKTQ